MRLQSPSFYSLAGFDDKGAGRWSAGTSAPFHAAWRLKPGAKEPVRIYYGAGSLAVPKPIGTAH